MNIPATMQKDSNTEPQPTILTIPLDSLRKPSPLIKNPVRGRNGISQANEFINMD